jgi:hypothetical protein
VIEGFIGLIGHGKTMLAVDHCISLARRRGAVLAANIKVTDGDLDFVQLSVGNDGLDLDELRELMELCRWGGRGLVLLIDEVGIIMPARFWQSFPIDLMFVLSQSRKLGVDMVYTSQDVEQVDAFLRRLTQWVFKLRCYPAPSITRRERGKRPLFFVREQWRPSSIDKKDKRLGRTFIRYRREREDRYDTDELVRPPERLRERQSRRAKRSPAGDAGGAEFAGSPELPEGLLPGVDARELVPAD